MGSQHHASILVNQNRASYAKMSGVFTFAKLMAQKTAQTLEITPNTVSVGHKIAPCRRDFNTRVMVFFKQRVSK